MSGIFENKKKIKKYCVLDFNNSRIAVNQVYNVPMTIAMSDIIMQNLVWIGGGLFLGRHYVILKYAKQYKEAMDYFPFRKLMSTDQQILYGIYSKSERARIKPDVELQVYQNGHNKWFYHNPWFYLGYVMRKDIYLYMNTA